MLSRYFKRVMILAPLLLALAGCGGSTLGQQLGLTTAGSATGTITHKTPGYCPDVTFAGSIPLEGFHAGCIYDPATGRTSETIDLAKSDPTTLALETSKVQAGVIGDLAKLAIAGATGGLAAPVLALPNGSATAMPAPAARQPLTPPTP